MVGKAFLDINAIRIRCAGRLGLGFAAEWRRWRKFFQRPGGVVQPDVTVPIHRQGDRAMAHQCLAHLGSDAGQRQFRAEPMPDWRQLRSIGARNQRKGGTGFLSPEDADEALGDPWVTDEALRPLVLAEL